VLSDDADGFWESKVLVGLCCGAVDVDEVAVGSGELPGCESLETGLKPLSLSIPQLAEPAVVMN